MGNFYSNGGAANSSLTNDWATPQDLFDSLNDEFHFDLDPCADFTNAKCDNFFTEVDDGLSKSWGGYTVFCNPPYGRKTGRWVKKAYEESLKPNTTVVLLIPARTDSIYFHDYCFKHGEVRFLKGRLRFGSSGNRAPFPSCVVIFR